MNSRALRGALALPLVAGALVLAAGTAGASSRPHAASTLWVAPVATTKGESAACKSAKYHTIPAALAKAKQGDTIKVCAGTYTAKTTIKTGSSQQPEITTGAAIGSGINLVGQPGAHVNAKGLDNGITVFGAGGVMVSGMTVTGALGEGILVAAASQVTVEHNTVEHNDNGGVKSGWSECGGEGNVPGDCGEGLHLLSATNSRVLDNTVAFNSGGVLLTDEFGPNHGNTVSGNLVEDNESDCGVTVVSHSSAAVSKSGKPQPTMGGTYNNTISGNVVISNGTTGDGGGVLIASGVSGGGSYDNLVVGNEIAGNGLSGVTIHQHFPLSDVSGNVIRGNWIGTNDVDGDPGTGDSVTTGVLVDNGGTKKTITVTVTRNTIAWDQYGIYDDAPGLTENHNYFTHVVKDVVH